jgi:hypothetical protein
MEHILRYGAPAYIYTHFKSKLFNAYPTILSLFFMDESLYLWYDIAGWVGGFIYKKASLV